MSAAVTFRNFASDVGRGEKGIFNQPDWHPFSLCFAVLSSLWEMEDEFIFMFLR